MKKTFKTMLALMAGAMTFTGCTSDILENTPEQIPSALKPMTFTATQESDATRAAIVGTAINWTEGDKISIFDGATENNGNQAFTLTGEAGKPSGTFEGEATTATTYYALYPYASSTENRVPTEAEAKAAAGSGVDEQIFFDWESQLASGESRYLEQVTYQMGTQYGISAENQAIIIAYSRNQSITFKSGPQLNAGNIEGVAFPAAQTATVGTADPKAMLMIGTSDDTKNIQFKNVCAYLKVTPTFDCSSIVLKSNGTESLAGTVTVDYNSGEPTTTATNGTNTVTLSGTIAANSTYYIAVLPATLESGFTVEFKDASDKVIGSKSTAKKVAFARNKVINLGSFNMYPPEGSNGSATRTGNAEVKWVQLWEDGPKFAEYNVGAASETEYGGYYCWGGIIDKDPSKTYNKGTVALTGEDDTATKLWGSNWRMPTEAEFEKLSDNCTVEWVTNYKGTSVNGKLFTGKGAYAANSIFFPAIGYSNGANVIGLNSYANCWTSTPSTDFNAYYMGLDNNKVVVGKDVSRQWGYSIRPVLNEATTGTAKATINGSEVDVKWVQLWADGPKFAEYNVGVTDGKAESYGEYYAWTENVASTEWGSAWRMPTKAELEALLANCNMEWIDEYQENYNGATGLLCTGKGAYASNSIFLPAAGFSSGGYTNEVNYNGFYWSSTPGEDINNVYYLRCNSRPSVGCREYSSYNYPVRAVLK